jgi:hypothetical protein
VATGVAILCTAAPAAAGSLAAFGPNSDFPDANLVMPFAAQGTRVTFFSISNVGASGEGTTPIIATWSFYDESGELIVSVERDILGEGGTDVVDVTAVEPNPPDGLPPDNLSGRNGFVVVSGDGEPRFVGNFTIANTSTSAAFGNSAIGLGVIGVLAPNVALLGTTFNPATLGDNLLIILAVDDLGAVPTSITLGDPPSGKVLFDLTVSLNGNQGDGLIAQTTVGIDGTALFTSLQDLFPGTAFDSSATISAFSDDEGITLVGFYGQALGPFGAGQNLRSELVAE